MPRRVSLRLTPRRRAADKRLQREFGITLEMYAKILAHQGNACAICKKPVRYFKTRLAVDHCHTTGLVRGLLCYWCNKALGVFRDDIQKLSNAAIYLQKPPATETFGAPHITAPGRIGTKKRAKLLKLMQENSERQ